MTSQKDLERKGAKCEVVATDFVQCTDNDGVVWWCSNRGQDCIQEPKKLSPPWLRWKVQVVWHRLVRA